MKNIMLAFIKHILLFVFANILAAMILGLLITIFSGYFKADIGNIIVGVLFFAMFGMAFTVIPYAIAISIIKGIKDSPIWAYAIGGLASPLFLYLWFANTVSTAKDSILIVAFMVAGAVCGAVYGVLDKKIQFSPKLKTQGENHD